MHYINIITPLVTIRRNGAKKKYIYRKTAKKDEFQKYKTQNAHHIQMDKEEKLP